MIRKRVKLFGSALREIGLGSTTSVRFTTLVPTIIRPKSHGTDEIDASGARLLLGVTTRATQDSIVAKLSVWLEHQDFQGTWRELLGTTMTPVVTATAFETLEIYPGIDVTTAPLRRSFLLPSALRVVARINGSITATPGFTFRIDAELYS